MNILIFSWRDPKHPLAGGAEQVMHEHAKGWIAAGHKVTLFASSVEGLDGVEELDGVEITRRGHQYHLGVQLAGFLFYLRNKDKYDFIVDQFHGMPFFTPLYSNKPKLAVIQEVTKEVWFLNPFPWPINWLYGLLGYILEPLVFLLYRTTPFMTGSESAKEDLVKFGIPGENITVVPHGIIMPKHEIQISKSETRTIIYLGALSKDKGIQDALKAFSILDKRGNFRFWVVGKGDARRLDLKNKVKFWGFVSQEKKFELLTKAHVLINPSIREGWGLVNIEANAMGTPVVSYNSPGLVDSVKQGVSGVICKRNTPEEMAKELFNLLNNEEEYKKLQKGAVRWSKNFSWQASRRKSLELIERLANG